MKKLLIFLFSFVFFSCEESNTSPCISDVLDGRVCIEVYEPVCGCNDKTYSNSCYAQSAGILSWAEGECSG